MTPNHLIQWPSAKYWTNQWNPIIGCHPRSPACLHCYAAAWAERFRRSFEPTETKQRPPRKGVVFCGNMTDLFGEWLSDYESANFIMRTPLFKPGAYYLWLTKRPNRMCDALTVMGSYTNISNARPIHHYFGFTAENQDYYDWRHGVMFTHPAPRWANYWLSAEPLLGPIDLALGEYGRVPFKWVVVGCESGPKRRPCRIEWVESIVKQCMKAKIPVFVKQLDIGGKCVTDINKFPAHLQVRQVPWATEQEETK